MAEDVVDHVATLADLPSRRCTTETLHIHGYLEDVSSLGHLDVYGSDAQAVLALADTDPTLADPLHPRLPYLGAEVVWAAREEMALRLEDVLARRTRALLLDARAAIEAAPKAAHLLARTLGRDETWAAAEVEAFTALARAYVLA